MNTESLKIEEIIDDPKNFPNVMALGEDAVPTLVQVASYGEPEHKALTLESLQSAAAMLESDLEHDRLVP